MLELFNPFTAPTTSQRKRAEAAQAEYAKRRGPLEARRQRAGVLQALVGLAHGRLQAQYNELLATGPADDTLDSLLAWSERAGALAMQLRALRDLTAHANAEQLKVERELNLLIESWRD